MRDARPLGAGELPSLFLSLFRAAAHLAPVPSWERDCFAVLHFTIWLIEKKEEYHMAFFSSEAAFTPQASDTNERNETFSYVITFNGSD